MAKENITKERVVIHLVHSWKETAEKMSNPAPEMRKNKRKGALTSHFQHLQCVAAVQEPDSDWPTEKTPANKPTFHLQIFNIS